MRCLLFLLIALMTTSAQSRRPRIAIGGILHESNSFASTPTDLAAFQRSELRRGNEIAREWADSNHEVAGYLEGAGKYGFEPVPLMVAQATPAGPVTDSALDGFVEELMGGVRQARADGLLLALHGAMVTPNHPHADAEVVRRLRMAFGADFPIVVTHDFHANVPPEIVEHSTALVTYKQNPHVDQRERGLKAAEIMAGIVSGKVRPTQAIGKPAMLYNIRFQYTSVEPLAPIVEETRRLEQQPKILAASVAGGYQYADVPYVGPAVVVVTDNDPALAKREAQRLSDMLWATRDRLRLSLPDAKAAVREAMASDRSPVVLVDMGDNVGGGSAADSTFVLSELLEQKAQGWAMVIADPEAVQRAVNAGVGNRFEAAVGGKTDRMHGSPVRVSGAVKLLHDGTYIETEKRHGGQRYHDQGLSAVIEVDGGTRDVPNLLMLTSKREMPFSLHQLISCGVYPERQKILVVKAAIAYRAAYEPIAGRIIEADTPGVTAVNPKRFEWKRARRPLFGLDE
jgi:microcystin degradation protein MlrC